MSDEIIEKLEEIANYRFDPRLPAEFKGYVTEKVAELDEITERLSDE